MIKILVTCFTLAIVGLVGCTATPSNNANLRNANTNTGYVVNSNGSIPARTSTPANINSPIQIAEIFPRTRTAVPTQT